MVSSILFLFITIRLVSEGEENILEYFKDYIRDSKLKKLGIWIVVIMSFL